MKSGILINLSGHALSRAATEVLSRRYEEIVSAMPVNFDFTGPVEKQLEEIIVGLHCPIDGSRPVTIIPPGQSTLSALIIAYLHGIMGHFPSICYLEMSESGIYLPKAEFAINSNQVRSAGRRFRASMFSI